MPVKGKGYYYNNGYKRFSSPAALRHVYEHQLVIRRLLKRTPAKVRKLLPDPFEIHHMDFVKTHNCPCNLLLLDIVFHSCLTAANRHRCPYTGKFLSLDAYNRRLGVEQ